MSVERLHLLNAGFCHGWRGVLYEGGGLEPVAIPVLTALLLHPDAGPVLVDTGFGPMTRRHAGSLRALGRLMLRGETRPDLDVRYQLRALGVAPEEVRHVVLTHLHHDHTGGICDFKERALCWVAPEELAAARQSSRLKAFMSGYLPGEFDRGVRFQTTRPTADPELPVFGCSLDIFGDGSIRLVPTPGHTVGHRSVWVRLASGREVLLVGDACYHSACFQRPARPGWILRQAAHDPERAWRTILDLRRLAEARPELLMVPFHDGDLWEELRREREGLG